MTNKILYLDLEYPEDKQIYVLCKELDIELEKISTKAFSEHYFISANDFNLLLLSKPNNLYISNHTGNIYGVYDRGNEIRM